MSCFHKKTINIKHTLTLIEDLFNKTQINYLDLNRLNGNILDAKHINPKSA